MIEEISLLFFLWCVLFGAVGQFLRSLVGLYKLCMDETKDTKSNFKLKRFLISLVMGMAIGGLCVLIFNDPLSKTDIMSVIACGYMGVDFVEGFMNKRSQIVK